MDAISSCCPTCRRPLEAEAFNWDDEARTFVAGGASVRFTKTEAWIMSALWRARNRGGIEGVPALVEATYLNDPRGGPESLSTVSVLLMHIRRKLEPTGYTIPQCYGRPRRAFQIIKIKEAA